MPLLSTDPIDLLLDVVTNDLVITTDLAWSYGIDAVRQGCHVALAMIEGEWFMDLEEGVPYLERDGVDPRRVLLGQKFSADRARAAMVPELLKVAGVKTVNYCTPSYDSKTRTLTVRWEVSTVFGDTVADTLNRTI